MGWLGDGYQRIGSAKLNGDGTASTVPPPPTQYRFFIEHMQPGFYYKKQNTLELFTMQLLQIIKMAPVVVTMTPTRDR